MTTEQICRCQHNFQSEFMTSYAIIGQTADGVVIARYAVHNQEEADEINRVMWAMTVSGGIRFQRKEELK